MTGVARLGTRTGTLLVSGRTALIAMLLALVMLIASFFATPPTAQAAWAPSIKQCLMYTPLLFEGVQGQAPCVAAVQGFIWSNTVPGFDIDGIFGSDTKWAVVLYQLDRGLTGSDVDGVVGNQTWKLIDNHCRYYNAADCSAQFEY